MKKREGWYRERRELNKCHGRWGIIVITKLPCIPIICCLGFLTMSTHFTSHHPTLLNPSYPSQLHPIPAPTISPNSMWKSQCHGPDCEHHASPNATNKGLRHWEQNISTLQVFTVSYETDKLRNHKSNTSHNGQMSTITKKHAVPDKLASWCHTRRRNCLAEAIWVWSAQDAVGSSPGCQPVSHWCLPK